LACSSPQVLSRRDEAAASPRPLGQLCADAEIVGAGGEVPHRPDTGVVEIDAVHAALADAATRLNAALARERSLSADLAHQLRTPLASLRLRLETEQVRDSHDARLADDALRDVDRLEQTIDDLLALARDSERDREPPRSPRCYATRPPAGSHGWRRPAGG